jgi:nucleolin
VNGLSYDA